MQEPITNEDGPTGLDAGLDGIDPSRLSRRTALRAAAMGGAGAAVFFAPKVRGFSVAPDYAAAASCDPVNTASTNITAEDCAGGLVGFCWGNAGNSIVSCPCGDKSYSVSAGQFSVVGNYGGDGNGDNGFVNFAVSGIASSHQSCTVSVTGNCDSSSGIGSTYFRTDTCNGQGCTFNQNFNTNGSGSTLVDCQGNQLTAYANQASAKVTLNCVCK